MIRRLTALLVMMVVLLQVGAPALACAMGASSGNCCPTNGSSAPCIPDGLTSYAASSAMQCCAVAPASRSFDSVSATRSHAPDVHGSGSLDSIVLAVWITAQSSRDIPLAFDSTDDSHYENASLTYLRTARLRL